VARYIALRLVHALLVLFAISMITFLLVRVAPGDPVALSLGPRAPKATVEERRHELGQDRSLVVQYFDWAGGVARGDLGESIPQKVPVSELIGPRIGPSLLLIAYALIISTAMGIPIGVFAARRRNRFGDHFVRVLATVGLAMPAFWVGLLLVLLLSVKAGVFPLAGYEDGLMGHLWSLTLPAITLSVLMTPLVIRTVRAGVLETVSADFVEALEARGLSPTRILFRHVLRNGIIPTVTLLGVAIGALLSLTVAVESVFALPGLGSALVSAVQSRDFPVIEALAVLFGTIVVLVNLATDVLYVAIDPRVRL
jgi:peptide/nickel transport system permease protein